MLDGRLIVNMGVFSLVSIKWLMDQGLSARITYDPNHVYLEIAYEPGRFPPPLDTQRPSEITRTPATVSEGGRSDKPSSSAVTTLRPTVAGLTFAERVAYQRAIEEVRWRHRIWPNDNPQPKPSLDVIVSQAQLEKKVEEYLRKSQGLADYWQRPITVEELQTEIDRMPELRALVKMEQAEAPSDGANNTRTEDRTVREARSPVPREKHSCHNVGERCKCLPMFATAAMSFSFTRDSSAGRSKRCRAATNPRALSVSSLGILNNCASSGLISLSS